MPKKDSPTKSAFENDALGFVYKNLINRDPSKRRIKPNENILSMDADFGDSESDDSDYNPTNHVENESDADDNDDDKKKTDQNEVDDDSSTSEEDEDEEEEEDSGRDGDDSQSEEKSDDDADVKNENEPKNKNLLKNSDNNDENSSSAHLLINDEEFALNYRKMLICSVCLGDQSHYDDEIVECDSCGISVHELCYGITADDNESIHSNASSASTEPWFCDPCKADIENPICDLCPNIGGIFKVTENGRWVHMVCALYISDVTFTDPENLRGPILSKVNIGSKNCTLCEDDRYSQTGVCICCDAGMCKSYFHVTCAQRDGLLQDIRRFQEVDPFIAYCHQHIDKRIAKKKCRNYDAMIARHRYFMKNEKNLMLINERTANKLKIQRMNFKKNYRVGEYIQDTQNRPKNQRLLDVSTSAIRRLAFKDLSSPNPVSGASNTLFEEVHDIQKKWHIQPAFSAEFVSYYFDRSNRIKQLQKQRCELEEENKKLKENESKLFIKYKQQLETKEAIKSKNDTLRSKIRDYLKVLSLFVKQPATSTSSHQNKISYNEEISQIKLLKLGQKLMNFDEMKTEDELWLESISNSATKGNNNNKLKKPKAKSEFHIKECATCKETKEQHMMALCDSCKLHYHLYCLDPPLRRMPKKTRFGGWQCSNCTENEEMDNEDNKQSESQNGAMSSTNDDSVTNSDIIASSTTKRRLRENPKMVTKYTDYDDGSNLPGDNPGSARSKRKDKTNNNSKNKKVKNRQSNNRTSAATSFPNSITKAQNDSNSTTTPNNNTHNNAQNNRRTSRKLKSPSPIPGNSKTSTSPATSSGPATTETTTPTKTTATDNTSSINRKRKLSNCLSEQQNTTSEIENDSDLSIKIVKSSPTKTTKSSSTPTKLTTNANGIANSTVSGSTPVNKRPSPNVSQPECFVCKVKVQSKQCVRCDDCGNDYHYSCLKPPMTKSPKRRGYTWCCFVCEKKNQKRSESHPNSQTSNSTSLLATSDPINNTENGGIKEPQSVMEKETIFNNKKKNEKSTSLSSTATLTVIERASSSNKKIVDHNKKDKLSPLSTGSSSLLKKNDNSLIPSVKKTKKKKSKPEISLLQKTNKKTKKDSMKTNVMKNVQEIKMENGNEINENLTCVIVTNPIKNSTKVSKGINKGSNVIITANNISDVDPTKNTTECSNHIIHEDNNNNNINNNNVDQSSTATDDINTVLNDILMLEEEVQNNKKQQQEQESSASITIANNIDSTVTKNNIVDLNDDTIKLEIEDLENNQTDIIQKQVLITTESSATSTMELMNNTAGKT